MHTYHESLTLRACCILVSQSLAESPHHFSNRHVPSATARALQDVTPQLAVRSGRRCADDLGRQVEKLCDRGLVSMSTLVPHQVANLQDSDCEVRELFGRSCSPNCRETLLRENMWAPVSRVWRIGSNTGLQQVCPASLLTLHVL